LARNAGRTEILSELVPSVDDNSLNGPAVQGALADEVHVLPTLADIDSHGHYLSAGLLGQPADAHAGVEATGVRQDNPIAHLSSPFSL
jgi:hypothetical protein